MSKNNFNLCAADRPNPQIGKQILKPFSHSHSVRLTSDLTSEFPACLRASPKNL